MNQLFCDGGVIGKNPSSIGGTWAIRAVKDGAVIYEKSGVVRPANAQLPTITNNLTELWAVWQGLKRLRADWTGTIYSDSKITLGRVFYDWKWHGIPDFLREAIYIEKLRLVNWLQIEHVLLDGHPTKNQLATGTGKRGNPVSEHNKWCDSACTKEAQRVLCLDELRTPDYNPF